MVPGHWGKETGGMLQEQGRLVEASEEGLGSNWAVAPMMMMMMRLMVNVMETC
jgi:hypothetical protein